jgi:hypothetical protein
MTAAREFADGWNACLRRLFVSIRNRSVGNTGGSSSTNKEPPMRLNDMQVKQTLSQIDAQVLPDSHPVAAQLCDMFGDHTFFLDQSGLKVLEPTDTATAVTTEIPAGEVVSLADWSDPTLTSLMPHAPETTGTIIQFSQVKH